MPTTSNLVTLGWKGTLGKQVVFRQRNGRTIISAYPDMSERKLTAKQKRVNETMKEASRYIKVVLADEKSRSEAQVRLNVPRNRLYNALVKEYYANHYRPLEEEAIAPSEPEMPATDPRVKFEFMKYLLENTEKSIAEIAQMTGTEIGTVYIYQKKFRQEKPITFPFPPQKEAE